jgi:hypothetical protein
MRADPLARLRQGMPLSGRTPYGERTAPPIGAAPATPCRDHAPTPLAGRATTGEITGADHRGLDVYDAAIAQVVVSVPGHAPW